MNKLGNWLRDNGPLSSILFVIIAFLFSVALSSCGSQKLRPDNLPIDAIQANYPQLEFSSKEHSFNGLGFCRLFPGDPLDKCSLFVQQYYVGTIQAFGSNEYCKVDQIFNYSGNQKTKIYLDGIATKSCIVTVVNSPRYPKPSTQPLQIHSFKGHLMIQVVDPTDHWLGFKTIVREGYTDSIRVPVQSNGIIKGFINGCGVKEKEIQTVSIGGRARISTDEIFNDGVPKVSCTVKGFLLDGSSHVLFTWMIWGFDNEFERLPDPVFEISRRKKEIKVLADPNVSIVSLNNEFKINRRGTFKFYPTQNYRLRLLTVKGRLLIWDYIPNGGWKEVY